MEGLIHKILTKGSLFIKSLLKGGSEAKMQENLKKIHVLTSKLKKSKGKSIFWCKNQRKHKENQSFEAETKEKLRKTNVLEQEPKTT